MKCIEVFCLYSNLQRSKFTREGSRALERAVGWGSSYECCIARS